jgi:hypothetical protein
MGNRIWFWIALGVLAMATIAGVSTYSYNVGFAQGLAGNGRAIGVAARPWGFGLGFPLFPFFLIFFWFLALRGLFWRGPWGRRGWHYYDGVPPAFEEWHRRAHARQDPKSPAPEADAHA